MKAVSEPAESASRPVSVLYAVGRGCAPASRQPKARPQVRATAPASAPLRPSCRAPGESGMTTPATYSSCTAASPVAVHDEYVAGVVSFACAGEVRQSLQSLRSLRACHPSPAPLPCGPKQTLFFILPSSGNSKNPAQGVKILKGRIFTAGAGPGNFPSAPPLDGNFSQVCVCVRRPARLCAPDVFLCADYSFRGGSPGSRGAYSAPSEGPAAPSDSTGGGLTTYKGGFPLNPLWLTHS